MVRRASALTTVLSMFLCAPLQLVVAFQQTRIPKPSSLQVFPAGHRRRLLATTTTTTTKLDEEVDENYRDWKKRSNDSLGWDWWDQPLDRERDPPSVWKRWKEMEISSNNNNIDSDNNNKKKKEEDFVPTSYDAYFKIQ